MTKHHSNDSQRDHHWYFINDFPTTIFSADFSVNKREIPEKYRFIDTKFISDEIVEWLRLRNLSVLSVVLFFRLDRRYNSGIHVDHYEDFQSISSAINIDLSGSCIMKFWLDLQSKNKISCLEEHFHYVRDQRSFHLVDTLTTNGKPSLVHIEIPHSVELLSEPKLTVSIRLKTLSKEDSWPVIVKNLSENLSREILESEVDK